MLLSSLRKMNKMRKGFKKNLNKQSADLSLWGTCFVGMQRYMSIGQSLLMRQTPLLAVSKKRLPDPTGEY